MVYLRLAFIFGIRKRGEWCERQIICLGRHPNEGHIVKEGNGIFGITSCDLGHDP